MDKTRALELLEMAVVGALFIVSFRSDQPTKPLPERPESIFSPFLGKIMELFQHL